MAACALCQVEVIKAVVSLLFFLESEKGDEQKRATQRE